MAKFPVNAHRYDPYRNFNFRIKIDNVYVAGLSKCSALSRTTEVTPWREAGDPARSRQLPGKTRYEPVTLEAGLTQDRTLENWADLVHNYQGDAATRPREFRKDIFIDVFNEAGQKVISYKLFRCWVSKLQALPELYVSANGVAIQTITIENEGWERDDAVTETPEP